MPTLVLIYLVLISFALIFLCSRIRREIKETDDEHLRICLNALKIREEMLCSKKKK